MCGSNCSWITNTELSSWGRLQWDNPPCTPTWPLTATFTKSCSHTIGHVYTPPVHPRWTRPDTALCNSRHDKQAWMSRHIRAQTTPTHASGFHLFTVAMTGHVEERGSTTTIRREGTIIGKPGRTQSMQCKIWCMIMTWKYAVIWANAIESHFDWSGIQNYIKFQLQNYYQICPNHVSS